MTDTQSNHRVPIAIAIIGVVGTLGAALIANWDKIFPPPPQPVSTVAPAVTPVGPAALPAAIQEMAPHAPAIELNQENMVWGEALKQFELDPGQALTIVGRELYASVATFPEASCVGPGYVAYTWQIRRPYPGGGDMEIRDVVQGGSTRRVGLGSMGDAQMSVCDEHTFKNNGLEKIFVELRYASFAPKEPA